MSDHDLDTPMNRESFPSGSVVSYTIVAKGNIVGAGGGVLVPVNESRANAIEPGKLFAIVPASKDKPVNLEEAIAKGQATIYMAIDVRPPLPAGKQNKLESVLNHDTDQPLLAVVTIEDKDGLINMLTSGTPEQENQTNSKPTAELYFEGPSYEGIAPDQYLEVPEIQRQRELPNEHRGYWRRLLNKTLRKRR